MRLKLNQAYFYIEVLGLASILVFLSWELTYSHSQSGTTVHRRISSNDETMGDTLQNRRFQKLNDNMTFVYSAYYDDRDQEAHVKIVSIVQKKIPYNFACKMHLSNTSVVVVRGYVYYFYASCSLFRGNHGYIFGYIICPLPDRHLRPTTVTISKEGVSYQEVNVTVLSPSKKNTLSRCVHPFVHNYNNTFQLMWNIELLRMYGVDRFIFYLENQSESVVNLLRTYEQEGIVELRDFTLHAPRHPVHGLVTSKAYWGEVLAINDCLMSQINSAKYVLFNDYDEVVVPRKHKNLVALAEDMFFGSERARQHTGSLLFRNVYFPGYLGLTKTEYPDKDLALEYNIEPLLQTTRMQTNKIGVAPKSMVRPETVDIMCVHQVFSHKKTWFRRNIDEDVGVLHHYRKNINGYMQLPTIEDTSILELAPRLIHAVQERLRKIDT